MILKCDKCGENEDVNCDVEGSLRFNGFLCKDCLRKQVEDLAGESMEDMGLTGHFE